MPGKNMAGCKCCRPACGWRINARGCNGISLPGTLIELKQSGVTIASGVTAYGMVNSVTRTNGGTGGTNGTYTDGTFSGGGGTGATFSYTITGGVVGTTLTVIDPGEGYTSPPTPVFGPAAGGTAAATATITAYYRFEVPAGSYTIVMTPPGGYDFQVTSQAQGFSCIDARDVVTNVNLANATGFSCRCQCVNPFPNTVYIEDDSGVHAMNIGAFTATWSVTFNTPADAADGACNPAATARLRYVLTLDCFAETWTLDVLFDNICCPVSQVKYSPTLGGSIPRGSDTQPYDPSNCIFDALTFSIPSTFTPGIPVCSGVTDPIDMLGGGGGLTISR